LNPDKQEEKLKSRLKTYFKLGEKDIDTLVELIKNYNNIDPNSQKKETLKSKIKEFIAKLN
jgi:hypothetical protein